LNDDFTHKLVAKVRRLAREACQQGISALILVEPIRSDSLRGARMQGTLQRARRALKNLATYEDIAFRARVKPLTPCLTSV
jgi:predicted xylose isomerase-like sugar epimerase